jgi:hypothetical protein
MEPAQVTDNNVRYVGLYNLILNIGYISPPLTCKTLVGLRLLNPFTCNFFQKLFRTEIQFLTNFTDFYIY